MLLLLQLSLLAKLTKDVKAVPYADIFLHKTLNLVIEGLPEDVAFKPPEEYSNVELTKILPVGDRLVMK
jgi:hypothetical protein